MSKDRNWAEHDAKIRDNPTLAECRALGASHAGYGWGAKPWGHWSEERQRAYREGYDAFHAAHRKDKR